MTAGELAPGVRVLVIEDDDRTRRLMFEVISMFGYVPVEAANGREAIRVLEENGAGIDAVLLDIQMPGMDGLEVLGWIRANGATQHLPVIAVTALAHEHDREAFLTAGCDSYLAKPLSLRDLQAVLTKFVGRAAA